ncbi:MAG: competence/damage-inducible protein A [Candidatus Edwardsbacteria bacterium RIFOXYD12_FULL_50_11]|nr:MAG: competence/damage-inducible protein A [Candidatus Edwardsbacteria bacterium RifOxyC12_full_54_24]OGF08758.1 MAG: competence/damage-inducible protein A [Candidatus Edwardsbacteria bacterium RifOxyA12_full_54_48]OGF12633.1 MAG: competence/damage-inducible protein A [Candidatus Edwardsbacteria bacterium GWE2_54_12]OGF15802.1 MAG: competence/damage-inducible protein A [Candidatus Edwardsbacteria bacterium RIFOXYD12_FULL_50_11]OGJ18217.1 MAG: competence/damage-inducible protein A [Candidatus
MKAAIITIGNEILSGMTLDTNAAYLSQELGTIGIPVVLKISVGDRAIDIQMAFKQALSDSDIVLCTGGLGPTSDDITKKVAARFFKSKLKLDKGTLEHIRSRFAKRGIEMPACNRWQAMVPDRAAVLFNPEGTAPGLLFKKGKKILILMPGVPREMRAIFAGSLKERLAGLSCGMKINMLTLRTTGIPESVIAEKLAPFEKCLAKGTLAYLPTRLGVDLRLTMSGKDASQISAKLQELSAKIKQLLGNVIYGQDDETMEQAVGRLLKEKKLTLTTAESCTGGLIADRITDVPGSSVNFLGSVIAYSNVLKEKMLGVKSQTLRLHGAVSKETAIEMANGVRGRLGSDLGLTITGIAGPAGGTDKKPVGLVFMAVAGPKGTMVEERRFLGQRRHIKESATQAALNMLRLYLLK